MASRRQPASRTDFHIAIVCALPREADAVTLLFDQFWDEKGDPYGRADGDTNTYVTGRIAEHNVVLAVLPGMGETSAAAAMASLRSSYTSLKLAFLVGICGGVPRIAGCDAFLGDVVISKTIIQYEYGRQHPGRFEIKNTVEDSLGRASQEVRSLLATFEMELMKRRLQTGATEHLRRLQSTADSKRSRADYRFPGTKNDNLYPPTYNHPPQTSDQTLCQFRSTGPVDYGDSTAGAFCEQVGCSETELTERTPRSEESEYIPEIFIGRIGSGNAVMKSGEDRDRIAEAHNIIAFEMEGAGAWDQIPCIVVKGICDYADSHKNKKWQDFAAATAASVTRSLLDRYIVNDKASGRSRLNGK